jgi:predicted Fe-Mo cluster-binding NifX family protein
MLSTHLSKDPLYYNTSAAWSVSRGMKILLPSESETGLMSNISAEFEKSKYYTVAEIIDGTVAGTLVKAGFPSPPPPEKWISIARKLNVDAVVANSISEETARVLRSGGIRVVAGARGLTGMFVDWIANLGIDDFELKVREMNAPPAVQQKQPQKPPAPAAVLQSANKAPQDVKGANAAGTDGAAAATEAKN